jgi:hypothetical protein
VVFEGSVLGGRRHKRLVQLIAVDRVPEVANPTTERTPDLGKPLGAEHEQGHDEDEEQVRGLEDVADHQPKA